MKFNLISGMSKSLKIAICSGLIAAGLTLGFIASFKSDSIAREAEAAERYGGQQTTVCVAKRDIAGGETIKDTDIEEKQWISSLLPEEAVASKSDCVGKQLGSSILKGEVVSASRFQSGDAGLNVPNGMVAVSLPLDDTSSVGGTLRVSQKVDVYATGSSSTSKICSNATILETSNSDKSVSAETKWITIAVEKDKAQEVVSAAQKLSLYVVLPGDSAAKENTDLEDE